MGRDSRRLDKWESRVERGNQARTRESKEAAHQIAEGVATYYDDLAEARAYAPCSLYPDCEVCGG